VVPAALLTEAEVLLAACRDKGVKLATVESCTGGLIAAVLTAIAGASDVFDRSFVTYSNEAKTELVGVPAALIQAHGAVSEAVAQAMATGGIVHSRATIAVSVTGVAGPGGGSPTKPVGLLCFGLARRGEPTQSLQRVFPGDRTAVRAAAVAMAFALIRERL
jgi:nicotinamide-nucleotide amidase